MASSSASAPDIDYDAISLISGTQSIESHGVNTSTLTKDEIIEMFSKSAQLINRLNNAVQIARQTILSLNDELEQEKKKNEQIYDLYNRLTKEIEENQISSR